MKKSIYFLVAVCLLLVLSACNMNDRQGATERTDDGKVGMKQSQTRTTERGKANNREHNRHYIDNSYTQDRVYSNDVHYHRNTQLTTNEKLAEAIANLDGIDFASVMLTENNAYVGVKTDPEQNSSQKVRNQDKNRVKTRNNKDHKNNTNKQNQADDVAVSEQIKKAVSKKVRELHPDIKNVYVSANPNFVDRLDNMIQSIGTGQPVRGLVNEFNTMVERIFPENK